MQLLVSVSDADEALDAILGAADVIDAKDPSAGPLGAVHPSALRSICHAVAFARPVSAALGDGSDAGRIEAAASDAAALGVATVKLGFAGHPSASEVRALLGAAIRGAAKGASGAVSSDTHGCGLFAVAYADWQTTYGPSPSSLVDLASHAGAAGVLIDTADKAGPGLRTLMNAAALAAFVREAHDAGLQVALAGQLSADDVSLMRDVGADLSGVRGAACEGGRSGRLSVDRVRQLVGRARGASPDARAGFENGTALTGR